MKLGPRLTLIALPLILLLTGCTETKDGRTTIEGPGIYFTKGGRLVLATQAQDYPIDTLDLVPIFESDGKCRDFSDETGETLFHGKVCKEN